MENNNSSTMATMEMDWQPEDDDGLDPHSLSYRQLQKESKKRGLPAKGTTTVLRDNLLQYLQDPAGTRQKLAQEKEEKAKALKAIKSKFIDWANSAAKEILDQDMERGGWLYDQQDLDARIVFDFYKTNQEEFEDVIFEQFEGIYTNAIDRALKRRERSLQEEEWMKHDRRLHPRKTHNHRGEPVFDMDDKAKEQLQDDVKNKLHLEMKPMDLHALRDVYQKYKLSKFCQRIYQEVQRIKFVNYLEMKRTKKRKKHAARKAKWERNNTNNSNNSNNTNNSN